MKRRTLLQSAVALAVIGPAWFRRAFAQAKACGPGDGSGPAAGAPVAAAYRRAQKLGKPLLVLVIPADDQRKYEVGHRLGEFLNNASEAQLAPLALAEVMCATAAQFSAFAPVPGQGEPAMLLVETDAVPAKIDRIDIPFAKIAFGGKWPSDGKPDHTNADIDASVAQIAKAVREALVPDRDAVKRRAAQASAALHGDAKAQVEQPESLSPADADRLAALLVARWGDAPRATHALFQAAAARLREKPAPGARWARASGCGLDIEGEPAEMIDCGMGFVPQKSQRFLYLFAKAKK